MPAAAAFIYRRADIAGPMDRRDMSAAGTGVIAGKAAGSGANVKPAENGVSAEIGTNSANGETVATIAGNRSISGKST
ncbi:hypothetical protein RP75_22890 [Agrobacterium arsenijevicii]|uniref:Uncharacterized protein n=1 Tax=Agrobacterium arsenijevicii TaxID=1585697 RepID=A0ABR5D1Y1_9HYPH|nr:hypothetical protein RP75_22890 [Agrobacterium arsenijevicii]